MTAAAESDFHETMKTTMSMPAILRTPSHLLRCLAPLLMLIQFSASNAMAQPRITSQPASLAVLLSSNATFRVIATGTAPLTYQWQLDGRELADATNASLVVSNVTLADLGSYTVAVRDGTGETTSQPA